MFKYLFFALVVRPLILLILGINVRHRHRLPEQGPAILIANHNSHLDTLTLMSLYPLKKVKRIRPVAADDYFLKNKWLAWFSLQVIGIIPISRTGMKARRDLFAPISDALEKGDIIIFFPEGSRGEPERLSDFKSGIAHVARRHPEVPIYPIFMHGLGKALPKGDPLFVPFFCDIFIGEPLHWNGDKVTFMEEVTESINALAVEGEFPKWE
ncbi:lysophospholipid acyltransferase family protein [Schinkia sp. CFF1]